MKKLHLYRAIAGVLVCIVSLGAQAQRDAPPLKGEIMAHVQAVDDGDTMAVIVEGARYKVRLSDIDAPEVSHCGSGARASCARVGQPYGVQSGQMLSSLTLGKTVRLICRDYDSRYSRSVCRVHADGVDVNHHLVKSGMAWFNAKYSKDNALRQAELAARRARVGIWSQAYQEQPWVWRDLCWKRGVCRSS